MVLRALDDRNTKFVGIFIIQCGKSVTNYKTNYSFRYFNCGESILCILQLISTRHEMLEI